MEAMLQTALREDALTATPEGFELRLGLSWIRSMPLSSVAGLAVEVDGIPVAPGELTVVLGARRVRADALQAESGWWLVQDRLAKRLQSCIKIWERVRSILLAILMMTSKRLARFIMESLF